MRILLFLSIALLCACIGSRQGPEGPLSFQAGAARVDITPDYPVRLSGYGARTNDSQGVDQRIYATALALSDRAGEGLTVVLTVDNLGVPQWMTDTAHAELSRKHKIAREQFAVCSTHTHTAPMLTGVAPNLFSKDLTERERETIDRYTRELQGKLVEAATRAIESLAPAELWWGQGRAGFGANRRTQGGPVDHDVPLLAAKALDGNWKAVWANYACHCTSINPGINKVCGDWAGYAQEYFEQSAPGAISLVSIGCGADINPSPRGETEHAQRHGRELAAEMRAMLDRPLTRLTSLPKGKVENFKLAFDTLPTRDEWERRSKQPGITGYHAKVNLARLDRGEALQTELPYSVQSWVFGDQLAMLFLPGEVVVDYAVRLKREYDRDRLWVNAYANDAPCYIPSERIWDEGGYEGGGAMPYYDRPTRLARDTEARIFEKLHGVIPPGFKADARQAALPRPQSPEQALASFQLEAGLEIELVASEPLVVDPVAIDFGADGKLWVVEMHDYPTGLDGNYKPGGRLKYLRDSNGDGKFDRAVTLADDLPFPTGVMAWGKGALVCAAPDILYIEDTNSDGKAGARRKLFSGFYTDNYQARVNSLRWGLDGWVYGAAGLFGGTIHSHLTGKDHPLSGRDFRMKPDTGEFEPASGLSQQGRVRDDFGNWFGCDNGTWAWHFPYAEQRLARNPHVVARNTAITVAREPNANQLFPISRTLARFNDPDHANRTTSACGLEIYRAAELGPEFYQNAFIAEPVHNLVRRFTLAPSGSTFAATRPGHLSRSEFLASKDNWFRPAEIRTGPDGALWVVDMYRFVVEHPRWISPERLAELDVRAGADQGRIYRVKPRGFTAPAAWKAVAGLSAAELAGALQSENGVLRDLAHRELLARKDVPGLAGRLAQAFASSKPAAQAQILSLQQQLNPQAASALFLPALNSPDASLRKLAVQQLGEPPAAVTPALLQRLLTMTNDPSAHVRAQLAFTLGRFKTAEATEALVHLALGPADEILDTAIASGEVENASRILRAILRDNARERLVQHLLVTVARSGARADRLALVQTLASNGTLDRTGWSRLATLLGADPAIWRESGAQIAELRERALESAENSQLELSARAAALSALAGASLSEAETSRLIRFLQPDQPIELQKAALNALQSSQYNGLAGALFRQWNGLPARIQPAVIDLALARDEWASDLARALESKALSVQQLTPVQRQALQTHRSAEVRRSAQKIFEASVNADRQMLVQQYAAAMAGIRGDAEEGLRLFAQNCASCHLFRDVGGDVGPDIATYRGKASNDYLQAILDPSAVVEPRFITKVIELADGRSLTGIIETESANGLTLVQGNGAKETILRAHIKTVEVSAHSLMPEGFEASLLPRQMADLISYLQLPDPRPFGSSAYVKKPFSFTNGAARITHAAERLDYPSWLGTLPLAHCRQTDGQSEVAWETAPLKGFSGEEWVRFEFPIGLGFASQRGGSFAFFMNDQPVFEFDVALHDAFWDSATLPVRATYMVHERNGQDSNGLLVLLVKGTALKDGQPARFRVRGSASGSQRWFGLYETASSAPRVQARSAN